MGEPCPDIIIPILAQCGTWVLVLVGWVALHLTAGSRARRQEEWDRVEDIVKRIEAIRDKSIDYYMADAEVQERAANQARLKYELQSLASWIKLLRDRRSNYYHLHSEQIALRKAVTGGEFESPKRASAAPDAPVIQELWYAADIFILALHAEFEKANKRR